MNGTLGTLGLLSLLALGRRRGSPDSYFYGVGDDQEPPQAPGKAPILTSRDTLKTVDDFLSFFSDDLVTGSKPLLFGRGVSQEMRRTGRSALDTVAQNVANMTYEPVPYTPAMKAVLRKHIKVLAAVPPASGWVQFSDTLTVSLGELSQPSSFDTTVGKFDLADLGLVTGRETHIWFIIPPHLFLNFLNAIPAFSWRLGTVENTAVTVHTDLNSVAAPNFLWRKGSPAMTVYPALDHPRHAFRAPELLLPPLRSLGALIGLKKTRLTAQHRLVRIPLDLAQNWARQLERDASWRKTEDGGFPHVSMALRKMVMVDSVIRDCTIQKELAGAMSLKEIGNAGVRRKAEAVVRKAKKNVTPGNKFIPYQEVAIAYWQLSGRSCMLADEMGLGKTISAIGSILVDPATTTPTLICCPSKVQGMWATTIAEWSDLSVLIMDGSTPVPAKARPNLVCICSYEFMTSNFQAIQRAAFRYVILDESQYLKKPTSSRSRAMLSIIRNSKPPITQTLLLTGTPMDELEHLLSQLPMIDPQFWYDYRAKKHPMFKAWRYLTSLKLTQKNAARIHQLAAWRPLADTLAYRYYTSVTTRLVHDDRDLLGPLRDAEKQGWSSTPVFVPRVGWTLKVPTVDPGTPGPGRWVSARMEALKEFINSADFILRGWTVKGQKTEGYVLANSATPRTPSPLSEASLAAFRDRIEAIRRGKGQLITAPGNVSFRIQTNWVLDLTSVEGGLDIFGVPIVRLSFDDPDLYRDVIDGGLKELSKRGYTSWLPKQSQRSHADRLKATLNLEIGRKVLSQVQAKMRQKMKVWLRCFVLQRTKQQVLPDLPPKTRISVNLKLSPAERKIYQTGLTSILQKLHGDRMNKAAATFVASYRYYLDIGLSRKIAFDTALEEINQRLQTDDVNKALLQMLLRGLVGKVKVPAVIAYIRKLMKKEPGAPMLIFVDQKAVKTRLKAALSQMSWGRTGRKIRVGEIVGGMSRKRSDQTVEDFQNGDYDLLLLSTAATTGITLHRAKIVVFAERFWLPSTELQMQDRAHRIGLKHPVTVYKLMAENTIDEHIGAILDRKSHEVADALRVDKVKTSSQQQTVQLAAAEKGVAQLIQKELDAVIAKGAQPNLRFTPKAAQKALKEAGVQ